MGKLNFRFFKHIREGSLCETWKKTVVKVVVASGIGTGFLCRFPNAPNLLLLATNHHVLPTRKTAREAICMLCEARRFSLDPEAFFATGSFSLDFTLVALSKNVLDSIPEAMPLLLEKQRRTPEIGQRLHVLHHPENASLQHNTAKVSSINRWKLRYESETRSGSSGAPVLNEKLRLVALHYGGFEDRSLCSGIFVNRIIDHVGVQEALSLHTGSVIVH